ncbi:Uu.00g009910.m01.CDS01 [Anthostomella pinea]|uniref:Uu.00g009910.m01.CDS01 n=1 Tax=Anthostomella pinea TaxID=933095 RepID=A0AAI8YMN2_9PEZI|nr:Uu.00g009910.m01.CDS01 [Anthostomella pinea]
MRSRAAQEGCLRQRQTSDRPLMGSTHQMAGWMLLKRHTEVAEDAACYFEAGFDRLQWALSSRSKEPSLYVRPKEVVAPESDSRPPIVIERTKYTDIEATSPSQFQRPDGYGRFSEASSSTVVAVSSPRHWRFDDITPTGSALGNPQRGEGCGQYTEAPPPTMGVAPSPQRARSHGDTLGL